MRRKCSTNDGAPNCLRPNRDLNNPNAPTGDFYMAAATGEGWYVLAGTVANIRTWVLVGGNPAEDYITVDLSAVNGYAVVVYSDNSGYYAGEIFAPVNSPVEVAPGDWLDSGGGSPTPTFL